MHGYVAQKPDSAQQLRDDKQSHGGRSLYHFQLRFGFVAALAIVLTTSSTRSCFRKPFVLTRSLPSPCHSCRMRRCAIEEASGEEVTAAVREGGAVVLDVYAKWCGPCKLLEPVVEQMALRLQSGDFEEDGVPPPRVLRMDSDAHPGRASALDIEELPTVIFFQGGAELGRVKGAMSLSDLENFAARVLSLKGFEASSPKIVELMSLEELELNVQMEDVMMLGVMASGSHQEDSSALQGTLQVFATRPAAEDLQIFTIDATRIPGVVKTLQLADLPAFVLFQEGQKVAQLEGSAAAAVTMKELEETFTD